ncbi:hypothetical protein BUALT_Bualt04G0026800 [Buddleja alternifolia]|uniref:Transposase n=1 Tax=Buddleja alternifolia TaxID=168488 RepID=A0AAV6XX05_9LAMI|nr:hypothetical protein BUALT_Bualt04G0026800 [Buddleja alternifolia]
MVINEGGAMFLRAVTCQREYKDKWFVLNLIKEVIVEIGATNVIQVITDNAPVCQAAGLLIDQMYPHIFWTPCVVHTINLALKNTCAAKNTEANEVTYEECHWITEIAGSAIMVRNFINNHSMMLSMFNDFSKLKLIAVTETRFASVIIMLKRFKLIKKNLQAMVISDQWTFYREDDVAKARLVKERLLDDSWWDLVDYILNFMEPIYEMLRICDTDKSYLHMVYEMWDTMISKVKEVIYKHEKKSDYSLRDRWKLDPFQWWAVHDSPNPYLRSIAIRLLGQVSSSSCCERNWSTYTFIQSAKRNKITPQRTQDLVFVHNNLRLLSRKTPQYKQGDTKMWDVAGDAFESMEDIGILEMATLSLDEPDLESGFFADDVSGRLYEDSPLMTND